jgi:hypothetical protein
MTDSGRGDGAHRVAAFTAPGEGTSVAAVAAEAHA